MLNNKTVVLTGASGGIGGAFAKALAASGAKLILVGRNEQKLLSLNASLGDGHEVLVSDISTAVGREMIASYAQNNERGVNMLVNNAGIGAFNSFEVMDEDHVSALININLTSTILLTQVMLPVLQKQQKSSVVNIGSTFGSIGFPGFAVYSASKFGIRGFSEALARELSDSTVSVRYFAPRATKTTLNDVNVDALNDALETHVDSPEHVAEEFVSFLKSNDKRCFIGWPEKLFARINGVLPNIVDNAIAKQLPIIKRCWPKNKSDADDLLHETK